jgi:hypothetical protein
MAIKYIYIFPAKALQNLPKLGFFWFENEPSGNPDPCLSSWSFRLSDVFFRANCCTEFFTWNVSRRVRGLWRRVHPKIQHCNNFLVTLIISIFDYNFLKNFRGGKFSLFLSILKSHKQCTLVQLSYIIAMFSQKPRYIHPGGIRT